MTKKILSTIVSLVLFSALIGLPTQATAQYQGTKTCISTPVSARGEPSRFKWIAKTKSHANWRQKIRAMSGLGDPYANWKRAENPKEDCTTDSNGTICEFTGIPCKKGT